MKKTRKYYDFAVCGPDGEWERFKVPTFFSAADVQEHRPHSIVALHVPAGHRTYGTREFTGPCWALWSAADNGFVASYPDIQSVSERELYALV